MQGPLINVDKTKYWVLCQQRVQPDAEWIDSYVRMKVGIHSCMNACIYSFVFFFSFNK